MKVKELIAELQKMQGDKEVVIEQTGVGLSIFYEPIESNDQRFTPEGIPDPNAQPTDEKQPKAGPM